MDSKHQKNIENLISDLETINDRRLSMLVGLDGFIDEVVHVVDKRTDIDTYTRVETLGSLGERISKAAGLSTNMELVSIQSKIGGNGPNLTAALLGYDIDVTYIGTIGENSIINPVFKPMADKCKAVYPLSNPGRTDAMEFLDGKLMLGKLDILKDLTWAKIKDDVGGPKNLANLINECDLLGIENWTMIPFMSQIWEGLLEEVFPLLPDREPAKKTFVFFDLCDPEKKLKQEIKHAMELIGRFEQKFNVILGLNEKELYEIADALDISSNENLPKEEKEKQLSKKVYDKLKIHTLVIHLTKEAFSWVLGEYNRTPGPFCEKPVLTTGAGDNFNGGYCIAISYGFEPMSSLLLGVATSGYYVRNGKSPTKLEMKVFLNEWKKEF